MRRVAKKIIETYVRWLVWIAVLRHHPDIIAVSGITNKSTTKRAITERMLAQGVTVRSNPKSYNTEIGLPLAILYIEPADYTVAAWLRALWQGTINAFFGQQFPRLLVLEFGVSARGDMQRLLRIVRPRVAVLTNVQPSAFNPMVTLGELADEFRELVRKLPSNGFAIVNADDAHLKAIADEFPDRTFTYAIHVPAAVRAENVREAIDGQRFSVGGQEVHLSRFGEHHLYAYLAAEATCKRYAHV